MKMITISDLQAGIIKRLRSIYGSNEKIGAALGVQTKSAVSNYAAGKRALKVHKLAMIATQHKRSLDWLILGKEGKVTLDELEQLRREKHRLEGKIEVYKEQIAELKSLIPPFQEGVDSRIKS